MKNINYLNLLLFIVATYSACSNDKAINTKGFFLHDLVIDSNSHNVYKIRYGDLNYMNCDRNPIQPTSCVFKSNLQDGIWIAYIDSSFKKPLQIVTVISKKFNGPFYEIGNDGSVWKKGQYVNGQKMGEFVYFNSNGTISEKENYINGKLFGKVQKFNSHGSLVLEQLYDSVQGIIFQTKISNGKVTEIAEYYMDRYVITEYFSNGSLKSRRVGIQNSEKSELYISEWSINGSLLVNDTIK